MHFAADQLISRDAAQHDVRVGNGGLLTNSVTGRARIGARALRADAQQPTFVHSRDRSAAGAHGMDVEHGNAHRETVDGGFHGFARLAIAQAYVGGRSPHVEAEDARESRQARGFERSHYSAGRSGKHGSDGMTAR